MAQEKQSSFKGLEICEMNFERNRYKCSKVVKGSCSARDCNLEIYKLGDDVIFSGGLCPKGNTGFGNKTAPDYIKIYLNILDKHLAKLTKPLDDYSSSKSRILIPRSLTFLNEKGVFYCSIYSNLGFEVSVSPESDEIIDNLGKSFSHSEFCYPLILAHGHAAYFRERMKKEDKILLVGAISQGNNKFKFCPYVASSGHVIMGNLNLDSKNILLPIIYFDDRDYPIYKSIHKDLKRVFGEKFSEKQVLEAVEKAKEDEKAFLEEIYLHGEEIIRNLKEKNERIFIGIGRGYTIFDGKANSKVHELFVLNGLHFLPSYMLRPVDKEINGLVENMYWYQGRKMIEQTLVSLEDKSLFPVRLTNFNCGPDSMLHFHEERLVNSFNKPRLVLETDGHNSNAQFGTRIQAHNRVVDKYLENPLKPEENLIIKRNEDFEKRIIGVPYMGDSSNIIAAAFRAAGFNSEVMPTRTNESIEISKKIINTNTCQPFSFQVGDQFAWLESFKKKGINPNQKTAIFLPTAEGPCRFGQYSSVLRNLFDEKGFEGVPLINPNSKKDYNDAKISKAKVKLITRLSFKGVFANELLKSSLLRCRPYEINKGESDKIYDKAHNELIKLIEKNSSIGKIKKFLEKKVLEFEKIPKNDRNRLPLVLMIGEIFMRAHEISNQDSIKILEAHGLEVILEPVFNWVIYVNKGVLKRAIERKDFLQATNSFLKKIYINLVLKNLSAPFKEFLKGREEHDPFHLIESIEENLIYNSAIEGEGCISIGGTYAFIKGELGIDGIYHVGPLGCMQETIATSRSQALIHQEREKTVSSDSGFSSSGAKIIPFMDAVFGESATPNLDSQIGIFADNCRLRREMRREKD